MKPLYILKDSSTEPYPASKDEEDLEKVLVVITEDLSSVSMPSGGTQEIIGVLVRTQRFT